MLDLHFITSYIFSALGMTYEDILIILIGYALN